ncbi:MAG TPA: hypothetical protein VFH31_11235 [Pyrinomonadaceae bacterium]|nr:hypothetical protein [Pyrinomonadaceae bacterium]
MQFIEKNSFNVRSAVYHFKKDGAPEFILFPMIHIGSQTFYDEIARRLTPCDLILAEGVSSKRGNLLKLSYRVVKRIKRMDLVTQHEALNTAAFREKIINADMAGSAFDARWSSLPLSLRVQLFLFVPIYILYLLFFGTRETLAENIALDDLPFSEEILLEDDTFEDLDSLLIDERDRTLLGNIKRVYETGGNKTIGVVYGAMHMRKAVEFLMRGLNYRVAKAEWVTVFDL